VKLRSAEDLLKICRACWASDWDVYPDQWTGQQVAAAVVLGTAPTFEEGPHGLHAVGVSDCACYDCRHPEIVAELPHGLAAVDS